MTTTRAAIIRRAMDMVPELAHATKDGVTALTATGGAASTLIDTASAQPSGAASTLFKGWYLWRPDKTDADQVKIISTYSGSAQEYTINGTWLDNPASADPYRVCKDHPFLWLRAYAEAMREDCISLAYTNFSPVSATRRVYQVDAAPISLTVARQSDILELEWHDETDAANEEVWKPWADGNRRWETFDVGGVPYIRFDGVLPDTTIQMRVISAGPYTVLTDETTTSTVDELWAAYAVLLNMWRLAGQPEKPGDDWTRAIRRLDAISYMRTRRRQQLGRYAFRIVAPTARETPGVSIRGRAGRGR